MAKKPKEVEAVEFDPADVRCRLVQRMSFRQEPCSTAKSIDRHTSWDYMGAAEYEFGALNTAFKAMTAQQEKLKLVTSLNDSGLWVLGEDWAPEAFEALKAVSRMHFKCDPQFAWSRSANPETTGWWFLEPYVDKTSLYVTPFAVFKDAALALHWEACLCLTQNRS